MSNQQNWIQNTNGGTVNIYNAPGNELPEESKDITLQVRVTPSQAQAIDTFCSGRKITRSDYIRHLATLNPQLFDFIITLNRESESLLPLLNSLSQRG